MAKIVYISKYPPLEGGIASRSYWLSQAMAARGHNIHVVTNQICSDETYTTAGLVSIPKHSGVSIYRPDKEMPWHIPQDDHGDISLLDKVLEVIENAKPDLIKADYFVPYGLIAYLANRITGTPYVLSHGGSDIKKFLRAGIWPHLWKEGLATARLVITNIDHKVEMLSWNSKIRTLPPYVPDPEIFTPGRRKRVDRPTLAIIGKINYLWQHKGLHRVVDIWSRLEEDFRFIIIGQGKGIDNFREYVKNRIKGKVTWRPFVPPWEMPFLLRSVDVIFHFENDLPSRMFSNLLVEALYCGTGVVVDREDINDRYSTFGVDLRERSDLILTVPSQDPERSADKIRNFLLSIPSSIAPFSSTVYNNYLLAHEEIIESR